MFNDNDLFWGFILGALALIFLFLVNLNEERKKEERQKRIARAQRKIEKLEKKEKKAKEKAEKKLLKEAQATLKKYQKIVENLSDGKAKDSIEEKLNYHTKMVAEKNTFWVERCFKGNTLHEIDDLVEAFHEGEVTKKEVVAFLKKLGKKVPASDVDGHLDYRNVDRIKELCEELYFDGKIQRTGNYRYYILDK